MIAITRRLIPVLAIGSIAAVTPVSSAQNARDKGTHEIYVSVLDSKGAPVPGLTAADFMVREDGNAREVLGARIADEPLQVALLIDDSQAAADATSHLREGLAAFVERMHGKGEVALITIGERPTVLTPYTKETEQLKERVGRIFPRSGAGAYLLDAILDASRALGKREAARGVILAVTFEGIDYSNRQYQQVLDELRKSGAALHVIAVGTPSSSLSDEQRNRGMVIAEGTSRTGGRRDQVLAVSGLPDKLKQAADELINQYVVSYTRPEMLIPPEKVEVTTKRPNLTVRARTFVPRN
ncbi:MAG: VWA domain-containing protein [Vicinamibacterales bacterium]